MPAGSARASQVAASWGWTPAVWNTKPGCAAASAAAARAASSDSPMHTTASAPASRARRSTRSRSSSNEALARWAWLSTKGIMSDEPPRGARRFGCCRLARRVHGVGRCGGARASRAFLAPGGAALGSGGQLARELALDPEEQRAGDVDGAEGRDDDAERHDPGEGADHLAGEEKKRERRREGR